MAEAAPVTIRVKGADDSVLKCLYNFVASPASYEIESLILGGVLATQEVGKMLAEARLSFPTYSTKIPAP
ncbi:MAG: hypothetical protein BWZ10_00676 [candidate division BRC1 bacterium ADurb.BinA364]|nr:MAG: hypothetical protein BWZ10_00676 [candidate division BRC1 bacterium ADurb.BinA364]